MVNKMRKTGKKGKVTQAVLLILLFMAVAIAGYSGFRLWKYYHEYLEDQELYEDLRDEILQTPELETDTESVFELDTRKKHHKTSESEIPFDVDWDVLKDINEDIIGWVYFTGLPQISYPVLQAKDNEYYVHRTYDLSSSDSKTGSIFMDYRMAGDFSSPYSVIYGHNVRDGSMLSDLAQLKDQDLYDKEPYFWILTPDGNYRYQIFSIFQCHRSADVFQRFFTDWGHDFTEWQEELKARNSMQGDAELEEKGHVIAFSTCVPNSFDRTIVCGKYLDGDLIPDPHAEEKADVKDSIDGNEE